MDSIKKIEQGRIADLDALKIIVDDTTFVTVKGSDVQTYLENLDERLIAIGTGGGVINPIYTMPTLAITTLSQTVEIGETLTDLPLDFIFIQNDAGAVVSYFLSKDGISTAVAQANLITLTDILVPIELQGIVSYLEGPIKNDSAGDPYPTGQIPAGSVTSTIKTITPKLKIWYGASSFIPATSSQVRALVSPTDIWADDANLSLSTGTTELNFVVAVPTSLTTDATLLGQDTTNSFPLTYYFNNAVVVTLPDGSTEQYRIYVLTIGNAYPVGATHIITL
jgi:hypothetical protein